MPDLAAISTLLSSLNATTTIVKGLRELDRALTTAELRSKLADAIVSLADARVAVVSLQDQIRDLQEKLDTRAKMIYSQPAYWQEKDGQRDGPFCPQCYDSTQKVIRLQPAEAGVWTCQTCDKVFVHEASRRPRQRRAITESDPDEW